MAEIKRFKKRQNCPTFIFIFPSTYTVKYFHKEMFITRVSIDFYSSFSSLVVSNWNERIKNRRDRERLFELAGRDSGFRILVERKRSSRGYKPRQEVWFMNETLVKSLLERGYTREKRKERGRSKSVTDIVIRTSERIRGVDMEITKR